MALTIIQDEMSTKGSTAAKAWVNFNGTGTVAKRADYNVTSITDNSTANYTINFTTAMADTNFVALTSCGNGTPGVSDGYQGAARMYQSPKTTTSVQITTVNNSGTTFADPDNVSVVLFGN